MQQVKLLNNTNQKFIENDSRLFQETKLPPKRKNHEHLDLIEPWMEDSDNNPFLNLKSKQIKVKRESPKIARQTSINLAKNWKSVEKVILNRQSKILPIMDIGQLNNIKRGYSHNRPKGKLDLQPLSERTTIRKNHQSSEIMLPSVRRELMIERKIFLMKNIGESGSQNSSPLKSSRIRTIINDARQ